MGSLRKIANQKIVHSAPCFQCKATEGTWDQLAGKPCCPSCEEALAQGEGPPFIARTEPTPCVICNQSGTIPYRTLPLEGKHAVEMDLCPEHLRALLGRRLGAHAFHQLCRQLRELGLKAGQVFLLHEAFYDAQGRALQPAITIE